MNRVCDICDVAGDDEFEEGWEHTFPNEGETTQCGACIDRYRRLYLGINA